MAKKTIFVSKAFASSKVDFAIRPRVAKILSQLKAGQTYDVCDLVASHNTTGNIQTAQDIIKHTINAGKRAGILSEVDTHPISFADFCNLDTVSYMRRQLKETKFKNNTAKTRHSGGGTRRSYSLLLWHFSCWLAGRTIKVTKTIPVGENLQRLDTVSVQLSTIEDLLEAYIQSPKGVEVIRLIKEYIMDDIHHAKSAGYMETIMSAIRAYFDRNDAKISFRFNTSINHEETPPVGSMTIEDLMLMLTSGKPSVTEKAVVLCKFHSGLDNSTFADRFNFEAFGQLVKWFGTQYHRVWDLSKCPVMLNVTRIKVEFPHVCCVDRDAIVELQRYLDWREGKTGRQMTDAEPIFLNTKLKPITNRWISEMIPKLALRAKVQTKFKTKSGNKNEKTSHELRDLLKSTLNSSGVHAYASNHLIGHMPADSYEKEAILYPLKIRAEYMKASGMINIFTKFSNVINESDQYISEISTLKVQMQEQKIQIDGLQSHQSDVDKDVMRLLARIYKKDPAKFESMLERL